MSGERRKQNHSIHHQIYQFSNLPRPELELEVADAGYSSLYNYESLSTQDRAWNIVDPNNKVCQAILARNTAGHDKKTNLKCQERIDDALASIGRPIAKGKTMDDEGCPHGLVYDVSSVETED